MQILRKAATAPGHAVRVVVNRTDGTRKVLLGHVLSVGTITPENVGTNGEPTITALVLDPTPGNISQLGRVDWHQALSRFVGLRHHSHDDVVSGRHSNCYIDSYDTDAMGYDLNLEDSSTPVKEVRETAEGNETAGAPAEDHSAIRSVSPLVPEGEGLSQYDSYNKAKAAKDEAEGKGPRSQAFLAVEVYVSEKTGVQVETMPTGTFCCYDSDGNLITHATDKGDSTMVFPTKETAIEFADAFGAPEAVVTHEDTSKEEPAKVS